MKQQARLAGKRILLVDDEPGVREMLKLLLSFDGHTVTEAINGRQACQQFTPGDFDLVLTDYAMPVMNGAELARTIKCLVPSQPIIMLSAFADQAWTEESPVDSFLGKPFTIAQLRKTMAEVLSPGEEPVPAR
jgi:two-component system, response regulator, stage 0 sporulation protein F